MPCHQENLAITYLFVRILVPHGVVASRNANRILDYGINTKNMAKIISRVHLDVPHLRCAVQTSGCKSLPVGAPSHATHRAIMST